MQEKWDLRKDAKAKLYGRRRARIEAKGFGGKLVDRFRDRYTPSSYRNAVKRGCKKAGVPAWTPYQLRHCAGKDARAARGIEGTSARLGNTISAAQVYAEQNKHLGRELAKLYG